MATDPFVSQPCSVVINNNYDTVGTLTRSTLDTLTTAQLKTLFTRDGGTTWVDTGPWFKTAFEMGACGIKRNGLYDWIFGSAKKMGNLVNITKMEKSPSLVQPFVLARQLSVINKQYWRVLAASTTAGVTLNTPGTAIGTYTTTPLTTFNGGSGYIRVATAGGFDMDPKWFLAGTGAGNQGDRINTFTRVAGAAKMGQYRVMAAAADTAKTYVDIAVIEENPTGSFNDHQTMPLVASAATFAGVMVPGMNNVSDYESWCQNRPTLNPEKRVPFWFQTSRRARRVDAIYRELFTKLMKDNQYYAEFVDLPLAEKNRQDEEDFQRRQVNAFFFSKPISNNQTLALYQSLEQIVTTAPSITGAGASSVQGKFVAYRANFIGVYEQLRACTRVYDIGNNPINMKEFLDEIYNVSRSRKSRGRNGMDIDIYTDSKTAEAFDRAMIRFFVDRTINTSRMVTEVDPTNPQKPLGFYWRSYKLPYPAGVTIHIITHDTFDDWRNAFNAEAIDTRGALFLVLDLGKGGIYPGMIATNRKVRTLGELENLAKIDPTYYCTMEHYSEEVTLTSATMTVVVECPGDNIWIENFDGFQVNTPLAAFSTATDLIGSSGTAADWYH